MSKRILKRTLMIAAAAVILLAILMPSVNAAWCAYAVAMEPSDVGMSGTFSSDRYVSVSGRLFVQPLKRDLACGETCEVEAVLYYNLWSLYRPGQIARTRLACTVSENQIEGSNFSAPARYERAAEFVGRQRNPDEPTLRFVGIPGTTTVGVYQTIEPSDLGHFAAQSR